ncbi:MAG: PDZ domain-containing protein, partial [Pseudomonadota bacterium]
ETAEIVPAGAPAPEAEAPAEKSLLGLTVRVLDDEVRGELNLPSSLSGLVVSAINESSEAYEKGLRTGDVITEASQQAVEAIADLEARIDEAKEAGRKSIVLLVRRDGQSRFFPLNVE